MSDSGTPQTDPFEGEAPPASDRLSQLATQLAALGSETRTERNVKRIVPWVISVAVHAGVIMLAVFITWTVSQLPSKQESVLIVADFNALAYDPVSSLQGSSPVQPEAVMQPVEPAVPLAELIERRLRETEAAPLMIDPGVGSNSSSSLDRFAPQSAAAGGAAFAGVSTSNARRIVYVIDASGSMVSHLQLVLQELARSLAGLSPDQRFGVVFFKGNDAVVVPPANTLSPGTVAAKSAAMNWINANIVPQGGTNPVIAIQKALGLKPDVIFMLSQNITGYGQFEVDQRDLMTLLETLNPRDPSTGRRLAQINCVQFLDADPLNTMELIAKEHGGPGGYKFLTRQLLGLPAR
jgi:hypothetical protein